MFDVEKEIKDNLAFFNDNAPEEDHELRFLQKLDSELHSNKVKPLMHFWRYAAAVVLLLATSYTVMFVMNYDDNRREITKIEYSNELKIVEDYYNSTYDYNLQKLNDVAVNEHQAGILKSKAEKEMKKLDANLAMIEKEYAENPDCDKLQAAIVNNKRKKAEVVETIVKHAGNVTVGYNAGEIFTGI